MLVPLQESDELAKGSEDGLCYQEVGNFLLFVHLLCCSQNFLPYI